MRKLENTYSFKKLNLSQVQISLATIEWVIRIWLYSKTEVLVSYFSVQETL